MNKANFVVVNNQVAGLNSRFTDAIYTSEHYEYPLVHGRILIELASITDMFSRMSSEKEWIDVVLPIVFRYIDSDKAKPSVIRDAMATVGIVKHIWRT